MTREDLAWNTARQRRIAVTMAMLFLGCSSTSHARAEDKPDPANTFQLTLDAPITTWDEAIPLGNGMLGGLLWGTDNTVNLSLDRGDLWDETTPPEIRGRELELRQHETTRQGELRRVHATIRRHVQPPGPDEAARWTTRADAQSGEPGEGASRWI